MRVALNLEQLAHNPPGGIGRYTAELVRLLPVDINNDADEWTAGGRRVDLVPFMANHRRATIDAALDAFGLTAPEFEPVRLWLPRPLLYEMWSVLRAPPLSVHHRLRDVAVVHAPSLAVPPRGSAPLVVTVHDAAPILFPETYPWRGRSFHRRGFAAAAARAAAVIAPTQAAADEIIECTAVRREQIHVVPHGVAQPRVEDSMVAATRAFHGLGDVPYVLWIGTLEPRKNLRTLVEAFAAVADAPDLPHRLVIVGSKGWLDTRTEIRAAARALGDRVLLTDPVPESQIMALYRGADLLAFPSFHEGFGLPVLEAMAQETAVLCSDIPVLREVAADTAEFVAPRDVGAWREALVGLLRDAPRRASMAHAGRTRADDFTWERCVARTRAVYRSVA